MNLWKRDIFGRERNIFRREGDILRMEEGYFRKGEEGRISGGPI